MGYYFFTRFEMSMRTFCSHECSVCIAELVGLTVICASLFHLPCSVYPSICTRPTRRNDFVCY
jgi:hypothetical protein